MKKFKRLISLLLVLCMVLSVAPAISIARAAEADADLWVDPVNGDDANTGTTEDEALKTIDAAKTKAAELSADGDVVVILKAGTYDATEAITFGEAESGKNGNTITYRAEAGETVLISGGEQLDGWTLHDAANNVYVTDIPAGAELTRQFYVDGEAQPLASMEISPTDFTVFDAKGFRSGTYTSADSTSYITIDLGEDKLVSSVTLYGDSEASPSTGKALGFPENFVIQTSPNGYSWTTQVTETGFTAPNPLGGVEFNFNSTAARYIRVQATKLGNPGTNNQTGGVQNRLAFAEVQVGFSSKASSVNLGVAQHVDLDNALVTGSNVSINAQTPYEITLSNTATPVAGISVTVDANMVGDAENLKIQATTDGTNWRTVYTKNGYTWKLNNTFTFNPTAATAIRITTATNVTVAAYEVYKPAKLNATLSSATGLNKTQLLDGKFESGYTTGDMYSAIYDGSIVVDLGSVQAVGGVRLYPTYNGKTPVGYMTAACIQVSTDGSAYYDVLELPDIQTPTGGAQILVFPNGFNARYVKIIPTLLTGDAEEYSLQLDEIEIVPAKVEGTDASNQGSNTTTQKIYNMLSWGAATPALGYYESSNLSGKPVDHQAAAGEDACIIDGNLNSRGVTGSFNYSELVNYGGTKIPAFYVDLESATTFNAIEMRVHDELVSAPLSFKIQAYNGSSWIDIVNETDADWEAVNYIAKYDFTAVNATAIRVLVYDMATEDGGAPNTATSTTLSITEMQLANMTEVTVEAEGKVEADSVIYDKIALSNANILGFGYYSSTELESFNNYNPGSGDKLFDGDPSTGFAMHEMQYQWIPPYGPYVPALIINTTKGGKPSTINAIEMSVDVNGFSAPYDFEIQVVTSADEDNWTTVVKETAKDWKLNKTATYNIPEMAIYKLRIVGTLWTANSNLTQDMWNGSNKTVPQINELSLYNIYDPTNPIAADLVSQGEGSTGSVTYNAKSAEASSETSDYPANRAVDGMIENMTNAGYKVNSNAKYQLSYLKHPEFVEMGSLYIWYHRIQHFSDASGDGLEIYRDTGIDTQKGDPLDATYLANDYAFIDVPGEWYIDRYEGKIYYKADGTMDGKTAYLPVTEQVVDMEYASNITFEGITFSHTTFTFPATNDYGDQQSNAYLYNNTYVQVPGGIELLGCTNVVFDGCEISNMGTAGIRIMSDGLVTADGNKVLNSVIRDISYNGITIGKVTTHHGYQSWMLVKNTTIQNNYVTRVGLDMYDSVGIFAAYTYGTVIDHNEVAYTPYSGISLGWGWDQEEAAGNAALEEVGNNKITYNYIHDVCKTNYDGGAIYTLGWSEDCEIAYNYIHDSGTTAGKAEIAIYLDEGTAYMDVHHNVVGKVAQYWLQMYFSNIHDNNIHDNYYQSGLTMRAYYSNNTKTNNVEVSNLTSDSRTKAIIDAAGLTDDSVKAGVAEKFWLRHDVVQDYYVDLDYARYISDPYGWYNVKISGQVGRTYLDHVNKVATIVMPEGTDMSALALTFSNESGWNCGTTSGSTQNFTSPVTYKFTNSGGNKTFNWTVNVVEEVNLDEVAAPPINDDPSVPPIKSNTPSKPGLEEVDVSRLTHGVLPVPVVGYYVGDTFTKHENSNGGSKMIDAHLETWGGSQTFSSTAPTDRTPAIYFDMGTEPVIMEGLEIISNDKSQFVPTSIEIQVKKTDDGAWESVYTSGNAPFASCCTQSFMFGEVMPVYELRILIKSFNGNTAGNNLFFAIQEITPWVATKGVASVKVPVESAVVGVYKDGTTRATLSSSTNAADIIDGEKRVGRTIGANGTDSFIWDSAALAGNGGTETPAAILTLAEAAPVNRVEVSHGQDGRLYTPAKISVEVKTTDGTWKNVGSYSSTDWNGPAIVEFDYVQATQVRVLVENIVRVDGAAAQWLLPEIEVYAADIKAETTYETGEYLQIVPESTITPYVGDYVNGDYNNLTNQDPGEASYLTDVGVGTAGWIGSSSTSGVQAAVLDLNTTRKIGGVEIIARTADYLTEFEIQVKKTDGTWVTVQNVTEDPFNGVRSVMYTWDGIEGTAIRVLCYDWSSSRPMLQEISVYEYKTGIVLQEVVPADVTSEQTPPGNGAVVDHVIDGVRGNSTEDYFQTAQLPAEMVFDLTNNGAPSNISRMVLYAFATNKYAPASITLEIQTEQGGAWQTIYDDFAYEGGDTDTFILDFDQAYDAYAARLTVNSTIAQEVILTEVDFFGYVPVTTQPDVELTAPVLTEGTITDTSVTVTVPAVTGGTPMYRLLDNDGAVVADWQTSNTFTGLDCYTKYTVEAMYIGGKGYIDSAVAKLDVRTEKTQLPAVNGFKVTEITETSITVTGSAITGGNLQFRINGGDWQTGGTFADLTPGTQYTIEARYNRKNTSYIATAESDYVSVTVTTGEAIPEPTDGPSKLVYKGLPAPSIGYYVGESFTSYAHGNPTSNVVDDNLFTWGGTQAFTASELAVNGGTKTPAFVFDLSSNPLDMNGVEIMANGVNAHIFTDFEIQVKTSANGGWETVATATDAFTTTGTHSFMFGKIVTVYQLRIMVSEFVGGSAGNIMAVQEVTPYVATGDVANNKVTVQSAVVGVYNDGASRATLSSSANAATIIDGDKRSTVTIGTNNVDAFIWDPAKLTGNGGTATPAAVLTLAEATTLTSVEVFHDRDGRVYTPAKITVQVKDAYGLWTTVGTYESSDWTGPAIVEFAAVKTTQVRVLVENITRVDGNTAQWVLPEIELYCTEGAVAEGPAKATVGTSYSIRLVEPWALRTYITFATAPEQPVGLANISSYGAFAIIGNKFDGETVADLIADPDTKVYTMSDTAAEGKIYPATTDGHDATTTVMFDFYDGLYTFRLSEDIHWVAYYDDADGNRYYTDINTITLTDVIDKLENKAPEAEIEVHNSMVTLEQAVISYRGTTANLGVIYPEGETVAESGIAFGDRNTGYAFGTSYKIKLIEPWGLRVRTLVRNIAAAAYADYENADDYGMIFYHDKTGAYNGMTAAEIIAKTDAKVFSKSNNGAVINAGGITAVYDQGIYTHELDSELYCLPFIVIDGEYYYPANAIGWNLLAEMTEFSENTELAAEEVAVFDAMIAMYENVLAYRETL